MKRKLVTTWGVLAGAGLLMAATCTERTTGLVTVMVGQTPWSCLNCPKCQDSTSQSRCKPKVISIPEIGGMPVMVTCGPCSSFSGGTQYLQSQDYENETDNDCTPKA